MQKRRQKIITLCECAMLVALSTVLSFLKIYEAPLGGAVTLFSMVPLIIVGFVHGPKAGFASAFVHASLQLLFGIGTVAYVPDLLGIILCILLDYILAFTVIGAAGFFGKLKLFKNERVNLSACLALASLTVSLLRFACHILSGAVVWYAITKEGAWNDAVFKYGKWAYSIVYNAQFMIPEIILTLVAVPVAAYLIRLVWGKKLQLQSGEEIRAAREKRRLTPIDAAFLALGAALLAGGIVTAALCDGIILLVVGLALALGGAFLVLRGAFGRR